MLLVARVGHQDTRSGCQATRPDARLETIRAGVDQRLGRLAGGDVAGDQLDVELAT